MLTRSAAALLLSSTVLVGCAGQDDGAAADVSPTTSAGTPSPATTPSPSGPAVRTVSVTHTGGEIGGTSGREEVRLGEQVVLRFLSDVEEEIHVHGYDLETALPAGQPAEIALTADVPGVFEVELHGSGEVLYQLRVS